MLWMILQLLITNNLVDLENWNITHRLKIVKEMKNIIGAKLLLSIVVS